MLRTARGLALSCHPLPSVAVTVFATAYAVRVGASGHTAVLIALAALTGQLTVGWVNDVVDAGRDRAAHRTDKPIARGDVSTDAVLLVTLVSGVLTVALSLTLGPRAWLFHLVAIGLAQAYNLRLKFTSWSPLPYVVAFGLLPVIVTAGVWHAGDGVRAWPPVLHVLAAALLGAAAHAGNTAGDAAADRLTGVHGLPQQYGPRTSLVAMAGLIGLASLLLVASVLLSDLTGLRVAGIVLLLLGAAAAAVVAVRQPGVNANDDAGGPTAWRLTLGAVALVVLGFLLSA